MKLEKKLKKLLISTYEKVGDRMLRPGIGSLTTKQLIEEIKNDTKVGIQSYKALIALTIELLSRDRIHLDERRENKINKLLKSKKDDKV